MEVEWYGRSTKVVSMDKTGEETNKITVMWSAVLKDETVKKRKEKTKKQRTN
jgi:hypothetical protein